MYCDQRSQYIRTNSKKNSFRGNYSRKYGMYLTISSQGTSSHIKTKFQFFSQKVLLGKVCKTNVLWIYLSRQEKSRYTSLELLYVVPCLYHLLIYQLTISTQSSYFEGINYTPSPCLTRIRFTPISLTRILTNFPFLTYNVL